VVPTHGLSPDLFSKESGTSDTGPGRMALVIESASLVS
jgi:hypothetical protein